MTIIVCDSAADQLERQSLDRIADGAAALLDVPLVLISVLDRARQMVVGSHGLAKVPGLCGDDLSPLCREVAIGCRPIVIQDARSKLSDPARHGWGFELTGYAGVPFARRDPGHGGALAAFAPDRRAWQTRDLIALRSFAQAAGAILDMRSRCDVVLGDERRLAQQRFQLALSACANLESQVADGALATAERERAADSDHRRTLELEQTSVHDELTGLLNRRGFFAVGETQLEVMRRRAVPGLLLYIDLDGLKTTNDRHGHAAGDELLRAAASVLRRSFRDMDTIARLGGDEFVVIATGRPSSAHPAVLAQLAAELARSNDRHDPDLRLTWSLGFVSVDPTAGDSLDTLMAVADRRMYVAKRTLHDVVIARSESVPHRSLSVATSACTLINGQARSLESRLYPRGLLVKPAK